MITTSLGVFLGLAAIGGQTKVIVPANDILWRSQPRVESALRTNLNWIPKWMEAEKSQSVYAFYSMGIPGRGREIMDIKVFLDSKKRIGQAIELKISGGLGWKMPFEFLGVETLGITRTAGKVLREEKRIGLSATDFTNIPGLPKGTTARMLECSRVDEGDNRTIFTLSAP
ncbi:MAG: hypothetical protein ACKVQS_14765 [Fimbriimonadaceae bacterium]